MKNLVLYGSLLLAFSIDHFYQAGQLVAIKQYQSQELTEAYIVADKLALKYTMAKEANKKLKYEVEYLRDANQFLIENCTPKSIAKAPLPKLIKKDK